MLTERGGDINSPPGICDMSQIFLYFNPQLFIKTVGGSSTIPETYSKNQPALGHQLVLPSH